MSFCEWDILLPNWAWRCESGQFYFGVGHFIVRTGNDTSQLGHNTLRVERRTLYAGLSL